MMKYCRLLKVFLFILVVVLFAGLAFGCGSGTEKESGGSPTQAATQKPVVTESAGGAAESVDDTSIAAQDTYTDLGGATLHYLAWPSFYFPTTPGQPQPDPDEVENYHNAMLAWEARENMFKNFNIKEIIRTEIALDSYMEVLTTGVLAGDPPGEWVRLLGSHVLDCVLGNIIVPFNDYMPADHDIFTTQTYVKSSGNFIDKVWTVRIQSPEEGGYMLGINLDILNALGLENPVDLYERHDGSWNYDKMLEMARIATKDTTGSGSIDQWGLSGSTGDMLRGMIGSSGVPTVSRKLNYNYDSPEIMRMLDYAYQIYAIDKSNKFDPNSGRHFNDWEANAYAYKDGDVLFWASEHWNIAVWNAYEAPAFNHTWVPFPLGPDNKDGRYHNLGLDVGYGVVRGSKINPKDYFESWFAWNNWYNYDTDLRDEANEEWLSSAFSTVAGWERWKKWNLIPARTDIGESVRVDGQSYMGVNERFAEAFYYGTGTPAMMVEAERPLLQSYLDQVLGEFRILITD